MTQDRRVLRSTVGTRVKLHATAHLLETMLFPAILTVALLSLPVAQLLTTNGASSWLALNPILLVFFVLLAPVYAAPQWQRSHASASCFLIEFIGMFFLTMGMAVHNSLAAITGLLGIRTTFQRTPKRGAAQVTDWQRLRRTKPMSPVLLIEVAMWIFSGLVLLRHLEMIWIIWPLTALFLGLTIIVITVIYNRLQPSLKRRR